MPRLSSTSLFPPVHVPIDSNYSIYEFSRFTEEDTAVDYFGEQLLASGYNYYGNEPMYSGITGQEFAADIYIGVVYYQRLRHMVLDKFQVRTTGPVDPVTRQPVKVITDFRPHLCSTYPPWYFFLTLTPLPSLP